MSDERRIPTAVWEGTFMVCGVPVECAVLDNGQRVITAASFDAFMAMLGDGHPPTPDEVEEIQRFARWKAGRDD